MQYKHTVTLFVSLLAYFYWYLMYIIYELIVWSAEVFGGYRKNIKFMLCHELRHQNLQNFAKNNDLSFTLNAEMM